MLSPASAFSTSKAEGPGHCGSVHVTEKVDGLGEKIRI